MVPEPVCANKVRNGPATADQPVPTKAFLQPAKAAAIPIATPDNMRTKSDDAICHHQWLKG